MRPTTITRTVNHVLSDAEKLDIADSLAASVAELSAIEREKADVNKGFKDRLEAVHGVISMRAAEYNRGCKLEDVECKVLYNSPTQGAKTVVRLDTGELVEEVAMSEDECQEVLFENIEQQLKEPPQDGKSAAGGEL